MRWKGGETNETRGKPEKGKKGGRDSLYLYYLEEIAQEPKNKKRGILEQNARNPSRGGGGGGGGVALKIR